MKEFEKEEFLYALIIEDLDETIRPQDKQLLDEWRALSEANEKAYQEFRDVQLNLEKIYALRQSDVQASWESLDRKLETNDARVSSLVKPQRIYIRWYQIAAAVLVILSIGFYYQWHNRYVTVETTPLAGLKRVVLPDGTEVSLNSGTRLRYHNNFKAHRVLQLIEGEVFIQVRSPGEEQFTVKIGDLEALDIGTSFNVSKIDSKISVIVEEGKVALRHPPSEMEVVLNRGNVGIYDMNTRQLHSGNNQNPNYKSWIDKKFVFNEVSVAHIADQLESVYKIPIYIKGRQLGNRKLTATLQYQTLDSAVHVISASLQCKVREEKGAYVLSDQ